MKACVLCEESKSVSDFNKKSGTADGLQRHCRQCSKLRGKEYYKANKAKHVRAIMARTKKRRDRLKQYVWSYFLNNPCVDCAESDPVVLEFDHVRGTKRDSVSRMVVNTCSLDTLKAEIAKCDVRCANCHRRRTAIAGGWYQGQPRSLKFE